MHLSRQIILHPPDPVFSPIRSPLPIPLEKQESYEDGLGWGLEFLGLNPAVT